MSQFPATITHIQHADDLHIVQFDFDGTNLGMMSLELGSQIVVGKRVMLSVKPTYIALAKEFTGELSYTNLIPATVTAVNNGILLSSIILDAHGHQLESVITLSSSIRMNLSIGDSVSMMIKASEISIVGILDA